MSDSSPDTAPSPKLRLKRSGNGTAAPGTLAAVPLQHGTRSNRGGAFLRKLLWLALAAWLLFLGFMLLDPLPFLFPSDDDTAEWWRTDRTAAAPKPMETHTVAPKHPGLQALTTDVAKAIVNRDIDSAMRLVQKQQQSPDLYPYPDALGEIAGHLRALHRIDIVVADTIREHIDETISIRVKGRSIAVIPRASAGERVNVLVVSGRTNAPQRSATFKVTDLTPAERARLLGDPDTPRTCLLKLYLHLEAGDRDAAQAFAPGCGTLADALVDQLGPGTR